MPTFCFRSDDTPVQTVGDSLCCGRDEKWISADRHFSRFRVYQAWRSVGLHIITGRIPKRAAWLKSRNSQGGREDQKHPYRKEKRKTHLTHAGLLTEGLEQIAAVGKNQLALAAHPEGKHVNFHASTLCAGAGFLTFQPKAEGEEIARRPGNFHEGSALWAGIAGGMRIR
jgi:hypothetical protein